MRSKLFEEKAARQKRVRAIEEESEVLKVVSKKSKKSEQVPPKSKKNSADSTNDSCVVYLGHIPHGFYEKQMYNFFNQFGKVVQLKHYKNLKTNRTKGYAFIKFESPEVASDVAGAIDGYYLQDRQLKCHLVPLDRQHEGLFLPPKKVKSNSDETSNEPNKNSVESIDAENAETNVPPLTEKKIKAILKKQKQKQAKLDRLGIDFNIESYMTQSLQNSQA
jgi:nucleolar protein 15